MARSIRVYQLAKELDVKSKAVLNVLQDEMGLDVQNHMTTVNEQVANRVRTILQKPAPEAETTSQKQADTVPTPAKPARERTRPLKGDSEDEDDRVSSKKVKKDEPARKRKVPVDQERQTPEPRKAPAPTREAEPQPAGPIILSEPLTVGEFAAKAGMNPIEFMQRLIRMSIMASVNQELDLDTAKLIADEMKIDLRIEVDEEAEEERRHPSRKILTDLIVPDASERKTLRAPVVTVMGHVDHGKTTLLDTIRRTSVTTQEMGGITQHIGASTAFINGQPIVFLDTPGHEAFTLMRARGAQATDIVVLVVAADDGVMPQTREAIAHARAAEVPIIVAVNKIDSPNAQPDRIRQELMKHNLVPEDWGGDTIFVDISALQGDNVEELLEMILLLAEVEELYGDPDKPAHGLVIESQLDKGRGPVATVLVQGGTLRRGDTLVAGVYSGRVRAMFSDRGETMDTAGPSTPVEILGLNGLPEAGDVFVVLATDSQARSLAQGLQQQERLNELQTSAPVSLEEFYGEDHIHQDLNVIIKADVHGSLEACSRALEKINNEEVSVKIIHGGVGAITESDIMLASASNAVVLGFNVRPTGGAQRSATQLGVDVRTYRIIYELLEDIQKAITGMLAPKFREVIIGRAEVRDTFRVPGAGVVAGMYVTDGSMRRNAQVRLIRDGRVVHEGRVASLRRFKDDVREVATGYECGLSIENYNDVHVGDEIEAYTDEEIPRA